MSAPQASLPLGGAKTLPTTQLIHGDCLEMMPTLPPNSVQMVFADLPYGVTARNEWDTKISMAEIWHSIDHVCKSSFVAFTAQQPFASEVVSSNKRHFRYDLIWQKSTATGFLNSHKMPLRAHEHILIFYKKMPSYSPIKTAAKVHQGRGQRHGKTKTKNYNVILPSPSPWLEDGTRFPVSVLQIGSEKRQNSKHPTQKPVALLEWLIRTYTNEGDTVLDPTAGSGTTAIAALRTGRHSICIEKDATYFAVAQKRIAEERARLEAQA